MPAEQRPHSEPVYLVNALEAAWNERDTDALADLFDEDAVLVLEPALDQPAAEGRYEGRAAILDVLGLHLSGGSFATRDLIAETDSATWEFEQASDRLRAHGVPAVAGRARTTVRSGRIQELRFTFSPETVGLLRAVRRQS